jgi:hypothetical protein
MKRKKFPAAGYPECTLNICFYEDSPPENLNLREIAHYLEDKLGNTPVELRGPLFKAPSTRLVRELAEARVRDFSGPGVISGLLPSEIRTEREMLRSPDAIKGAFYDGLKLQTLARTILKREELSSRCIHLIFTSRLFGTWDEMDGRYHARVCILGYPNWISTTGVVEAPAKPREFYLRRREGINDRELKEEFRERFMDHGDPRLTEVLKGYAMQAIFYHLTLEPFCTEPSCRLFNAHWQEEVIKAQLSESEFCPRHEKMLREWRNFRLGGFGSR